MTMKYLDFETYCSCCSSKYLVFNRKILTVLLVCRSFGNVIYDTAASLDELLSTTDIRSLE